MRNRTPTQVLENGAIRYAVYDEAGKFLRHDYLLPADDPTDEGTALNKENLLSDSTEELLFGSAADRTIDGAFRGIGAQLKLIQANVANITVTVQTANGTPISDVLVGGIVSESGESVYTNASGKAFGLIAEGDVELSISGYADIKDFSEIISVNKGTTITRTITVQAVNYMKLTSSKSVKFSGNVETVDVALGGGGASGAYVTTKSYPGTGGGMGSVAERTGISVSPNTAYPAVVGAGGARVGVNDMFNADQTYLGHAGNAGGKSSFLGVEASGGTPSTGGTGGSRNGPSVVNGDNGVKSLYKSFTDLLLYGGDGGGGTLYTSSTTYPGGENGAPGGGSGTEPDGVNGLGGGGHGCDVDQTETYGGGTYYYRQGKGGSGCVTFRMHLKSA